MNPCLKPPISMSCPATFTQYELLKSLEEIFFLLFNKLTFSSK